MTARFVALPFAWSLGCYASQPLWVLPPLAFGSEGRLGDPEWYFIAKFVFDVCVLEGMNLAFYRHQAEERAGPRWI